MSNRTPTKDGKDRYNGISTTHKRNLVHYKLKIEDFTCCDCPVVKECQYAYDAYNTQDDCLAEK